MTNHQKVRRINRLTGRYARDRFPLLFNDSYRIFYACRVCGKTVPISGIAFRKGCFMFKTVDSENLCLCSKDFYLFDNDGILLEVSET